MQEIKGLVSVIIPAFNAARFITDTIASVRSQTYSPVEIIVVDDGSADTTGTLVKEAGVKLITQTNAGVSAARNRGLYEAVGEYVVFLDSDDLLTPGFLVARVDVLEKNLALGFAGGVIETFPEKGKNQMAVAADPVQQILFFEPGFATVPSNYVFRRSVLDHHGILFNTNLNSTADRFFILDLARYTKGVSLSSPDSKLLYRISSQSMSHQVNPKLVRDNERYYYELKKNGLIPKDSKRRFGSFYFFSLALSFGKIKYWNDFCKYMCKAFIASPVQFSRSLFNKVTG